MYPKRRRYTTGDLVFSIIEVWTEEGKRACVRKKKIFGRKIFFLFCLFFCYDHSIPDHHYRARVCLHRASRLWVSLSNFPFVYIDRSLRCSPKLSHFFVIIALLHKKKLTQLIQFCLFPSSYPSLTPNNSSHGNLIFHKGAISDWT